MTNNSLVIGLWEPHGWGDHGLHHGDHPYGHHDTHPEWHSHNDGHGHHGDWGHDNHHDAGWKDHHNHGDHQEGGHAAGYAKADKKDWANYQYGGEGQKANGESWADGFHKSHGDGYHDGHQSGHGYDHGADHGDAHHGDWDQSGSWH